MREDQDVGERPAAIAARDSVPLLRRMSTRLILLTALFVLIVEVLIFIPSIANYRMRWLEERLSTVFAIVIPDQPVSIEVARGALRRPA